MIINNKNQNDIISSELINSYDIEFVFINKVSCSAANSFKGEEMYAVEKRKA